MVGLGEAIEVLYPDAAPLADYEVRDDGEGNESIGLWDAEALGPPPTEAELSAASLAAAKEAKKREMSAAALAEVGALFIDGMERDEMMFLLATAALTGQADPRLSAVALAGQKLLAKRAEVDAAATEDAASAVVW